MKTHSKNLLLMLALIPCLGLILAGQMTAQTFTTLHSFTNGNDGTGPDAGLILSSNTLYGTAVYGGSSGNGTVFALNTRGTVFTNLHSFTAVSGSPQTNSDGRLPDAGLVLSGNTLYGAVQSGGSSGNGSLFKVNTDGTGFTNLHSFTSTSGSLYTNTDGASPRAGLILSGSTLYGTAQYGGSSGSGSVFAITTDGAVFTNLHSFKALAGPFGLPSTNSDGANPQGGLILSGNTLYGTAQYGGSSGRGAVFAVNTDGTGFTNLYSFSAEVFNVNSDGANPYAGLILSGHTLYGTAYNGGNSGNGTLFAVNTNGTGFTNLHSFTATSGAAPHTNSDGVGPYASLVLSGNTLYGTAYSGGSWANGTLFAVNTNGSGFTNLHNFTAVSGSTNSDGGYPYANLILFGSTLFGTSEIGGSSGYGTVFSLSLGSVSTPQLTIALAGTNVILTWPTNATGFTLQSTTNLVSPAVWTIVSPPPVPVNGQYTVTNTISDTQMFYRLSK